MKENLALKSVGIWIRVSTDDQAKGESPEHHEKRARAYAEAQGWQVVEVYHLEGVSGKAVSSHPEAERMRYSFGYAKLTRRSGKFRHPIVPHRGRSVHLSLLSAARADGAEGLCGTSLRNWFEIRPRQRKRYFKALRKRDTSSRLRIR